MPVGLPAGEKKTVKIGRVLFEQIGPEAAVQTGSSFGSQGSPEVITDGAIRQKTKFPIFSFPWTMCLSHVILELR